MKKETIILIISHLLAFFIGFIVSKQTTEDSIKTEYIKGSTIHDTIYFEKLIPVKEEIPEISDLPTRIDTLRLNDTIYIRKVVDTAAILKDHDLKRFYNKTLFDDDKNGKLALDFLIHQNKMQQLSYSFTPIHQRQTIKYKSVWSPFVSGSYSSFGYFGFGLGTFYHDIGFELQYQTDFVNKGFSAGFKYKF